MPLERLLVHLLAALLALVESHDVGIELEIDQIHNKAVGHNQNLENVARKEEPVEPSQIVDVERSAKRQRELHEDDGQSGIKNENKQNLSFQAYAYSPDMDKATLCPASRKLSKIIAMDDSTTMMIGGSMRNK